MAASNGTTASGAVIVDPSDAGVIHAMWIPCVVFGHVFAGFFILRMLAVMYPAAWERAKRRLGLGRRGHAAAAAAAPGGGAAAGKGGLVPGAPVLQARAAPPPKDVAAVLGSSDQNGSATLPGPMASLASAYYDCSEPGDEEMGRMQQLPGEDASSSSSDPAAPSQRCQVLMHRLTSSVRPLHMEWQDIGCSYSTSAGTKTVLQGVWGQAEPGEMLALMGPSGAGKSTLMDILAGRKSVGSLTGVVLVNGSRRRQEAFRKQTAYVPQDDNFLPTMTVAETCAYYATLLLPRSASKAARHERITEVLAAMGLSHTTGTLVGGTLPGGIVLRGLSGGERKRLSIATGIMSTPCIIFLDEPTSGLDSFAALSVMAFLRSMAATGAQTVVSSIHQPRAAIWALFDSAVLLSMGCMMYSGPRDGLVPWFTGGCSYSYDPAMHGLASDWVMDLVNIGFRKPESLFGRMMNTPDELEAAATAFKAKYLAEHGHTPVVPAKAAAGAADAPGATGSSSGGGAPDVDGPAARDQEGGGDASPLSPAAADGEAQAGRARAAASASWFTQCRVLLWRELLSVTRNPADVAGRCLIFCWLAVFVGLIFYNLPASVDALRSRMNVLFVEPVILLLLPYVYMSLYTSDKQYFIADVSAKLYHPSAYYVSKQLAVAPFAVLNVLLFSYTLYGLAGLRHAGFAAGMNGLMSVLVYLIAAQVLTFAAVVMPNQDLAFMTAIAWTAINLLLSNFMVRYVDMNQGWLSQLRYVSAMGYAFDGYAQAEFSGLAYSCAGGLAPAVTSYLPAFLPNTWPLQPSRNAATGELTPSVWMRQVSSPGADCVVDLDSILSYFSLSRPFWVTTLVLLAYLGVLHVATYVGFLLLTKKERR